MKKSALRNFAKFTDLMYSLFIAHENDEWCRFVVHLAIVSPSMPNNITRQYQRHIKNLVELHKNS